VEMFGDSWIEIAKEDCDGMRVGTFVGSLKQWRGKVQELAMS